MNHHPAVHRRYCRALLALGFVLLCPLAVIAQQGAPAKEPDGLAAAQSAFESGDYAKSLRLAEAIVSADGQRWEGQVIVAASLAKLGKAAEAKAAFDKARTAVPADKRPLVDALERQSVAQADSKSSGELDAADRLRWRELRILGKDAQSQSDPAAKTKAMREFQADLMEFASAHPDFRDAWLAAAACALELDDATACWKSAQAFARLGLDKSEDDDVLLVYLKLKKKGWASATDPVLTRIQKLAEAGSPHAQYMLGMAYEKGEGVPVDPEKAKFWQEKSFYNNIFGTYVFSWQVQGSLSGAERNYQLAVSSGAPAWQVLLAADELELAYMFGLGGAQDINKAFALNTEMFSKLGEYRRTSKGNENYIYTRRALYLLAGVGSPRDAQAAVALLQQGISAVGYTDYLLLSRMHRFGIGFKKDVGEAEVVLRRLTQPILQNIKEGKDLDSYSAYQFAVLAYRGEGMTRDPALALRLLAKCDLRGADALREEIVGFMGGRDSAAAKVAVPTQAELEAEFDARLKKAVSGRWETLPDETQYRRHSGCVDLDIIGGGRASVTGAVSQTFGVRKPQTTSWEILGPQAKYAYPDACKFDYNAREFILPVRLSTGKPAHLGFSDMSWKELALIVEERDEDGKVIQCEVWRGAKAK